MSGKEIKKIVSSQNDLYYNIVIVNNDKKRVNLNSINDNIMYNFEKIDEFQIGCGMVIAYYSIERK